MKEKERIKIENAQKEKELREKILRQMKEKDEQRQSQQREALRRKISGQVRLKSAVVMQKFMKDNDPGNRRH